MGIGGEGEGFRRRAAMAAYNRQFASIQLKTTDGAISSWKFVDVSDMRGDVAHLSRLEVLSMATRVALIAVIIEDLASIEVFNAIVHDHREIVIGRMGIPYKARSINIVSIAVDGTTAAINALSGKLGRLPGVTVKTAYAMLPEVP